MLPTSHFGVSTGRGAIGKDILIAMKSYRDGNNGKDSAGDSWITLAGFAGTDSTWREFDNAWATMLKERYPDAPYLHMIELLAGDDPFDRVNGWCEYKVRRLIGDA